MAGANSTAYPVKVGLEQLNRIDIDRPANFAGRRLGLERGAQVSQNPVQGSPIGRLHQQLRSVATGPPGHYRVNGTQDPDRCVSKPFCVGPGAIKKCMGIGSLVSGRAD